MVSEEQKRFNREVIAKQQALIERCEWRYCGNCTHLRFAGQSELCALYNATPPLPTLVVGCESWAEKEPF